MRWWVVEKTSYHASSIMEVTNRLHRHRRPMQMAPRHLSRLNHNCHVLRISQVQVADEEAGLSMRVIVVRHWVPAARRSLTVPLVQAEIARKHNGERKRSFWASARELGISSITNELLHVGCNIYTYIFSCAVASSPGVLGQQRGLSLIAYIRINFLSSFHSLFFRYGRLKKLLIVVVEYGMVKYFLLMGARHATNDYSIRL